MAEITWIKLRTDMFDNTKIRLIEKLPEGDTILVIWVKLLAAAGKANCNGYIMLSENIPMNVEEMAVIFDRPLNTVRLALEAFKRYGMIEVDENEIIRIQNWEKHQNVDGMEHVKKLNAERQKRFRDKKKQAQLNAPNDKELPNKEEETPPKLPSNNSNVTHNVSMTLSNGTDRERDLDLDKDLDIDKEREKRKDKKDSQSSVSPSQVINPFLEIKNFFDSTIRISNFTDHKKMDKLLEFYPDYLLIIEAIKVTADNGKSNIEYVEGILRNWALEKGVNTYADWQLKEGKQRGSNQRSDATDNERKSAIRAENERRAKLAGL